MLQMWLLSAPNTRSKKWATSSGFGPQKHHKAFKMTVKIQMMWMCAAAALLRPFSMLLFSKFGFNIMICSLQPGAQKQSLSERVEFWRLKMNFLHFQDAADNTDGTSHGPQFSTAKPAQKLTSCKLQSKQSWERGVSKFKAWESQRRSFSEAGKTLLRENPMLSSFNLKACSSVNGKTCKFDSKEFCEKWFAVVCSKKHVTWTCGFNQMCKTWQHG